MSFDTAFLDKAIIFAVNAHAGTERRGKGFPYIVHSLEAVAIAATMTSDKQLLAAAALHDVVEDTPCDISVIEREFGSRVAKLVEAESDKFDEGVSEKDSWRDRKLSAINRLKTAERDVKIVALGDKLSNMRAIARDYAELGDKLWQRFHASDPKDHEWHYRGLAESLAELADTAAYREFTALIEEVFSGAVTEFYCEREKNNLVVRGAVGKKEAEQIVSEIENGASRLDFDRVKSVNFAALRTLLNCRNDGAIFSVANASDEVCAAFDTTGVSKFVSVCKKPKEFDMSTVEPSGDGFTADSFFGKDNDSMMKLYYDFIPPASVEREKRYAQAALLAGIPTPISGDLIKVGDRNGLIFERIMVKKSMARSIADDPENIDKYARQLAEMCKKLHSTPCDKTVFPSMAEVYRGVINSSKIFGDADKKKMLRFLDGVEENGFCVHGDLHIGNVIIAEGRGLFIDMADFGYGNKNFDLGTFYYVANCTPPDLMKKLYHIDPTLMRKFWLLFLKYYYGTESAEEISKIEKTLRPFAALKALHFISIGGLKPDLKELVESELL